MRVINHWSTLWMKATESPALDVFIKSRLGALQEHTWMQQSMKLKQWLTWWRSLSHSQGSTRRALATVWTLRRVPSSAPGVGTILTPAGDGLGHSFDFPLWPGPCPQFPASGTHLERALERRATVPRRVGVCMFSLPVRSSSPWHLKGGKNGWLFTLRVQPGTAPPGGIPCTLVAQVQENLRAAIQLQGPEHLIMAPVLRRHRTKGSAPYPWKSNSTDAIDANLLASGNKHSHISAVFTWISYRRQFKQHNS